MLRGKTSNNIANLYFRIWGQFQSFLAKRQVLNYVGTGDEQQKSKLTWAYLKKHFSFL